MQRYFITGIGTDVGKTVVSAIVTECLQADYWKPIQSGDLDNSDTQKLQQWVTNSKTVFHPNSYALNTPISPHAAAEIDDINISAKAIQTPVTTNNLVVEGAGGLLVPINNTETILNLIEPNDKIILVSRHYLGSINHTLLTAEILKQHKLKKVGIIFNGNEHPTTESIILSKTNYPLLGRIDQENKINMQVISKYATQLRQRLKEF